MTFDRESGLEELLRKEFRKFDPLSVPTPKTTGAIPGDVASAVGTGTPTVFIAAVDGTVLSKNKADYLASGVADDDLVNTAITEATSGSRVGRVLLSEGNFATTGTITVDDGGILQGLGRHGTVITYSGTGVGVLCRPGATIRDFSVVAPNGSGVRWEAPGG